MLLVKGKPPLQPVLGYTVCWMGLMRGPTAGRPGGTLRISHGRPSEYPMGDTGGCVHPHQAVTTVPGGTGVRRAAGTGPWVMGDLGHSAQGFGAVPVIPVL